MDQREKLQELLLGMGGNARGQGILEALKFTNWEMVDDETMEMMIDLMDALGTT